MGLKIILVQVNAYLIEDFLKFEILKIYFPELRNGVEL
jgi:hypothetical protein